jgi:bifunctional UDP-N-acetylglucosamine pyrophosphorylase/glucosamine-1-phosphate N-acetyltransferase
MSKDLSVIILAAGKGTRMKSSLPKTLHKVTSFTMLDLVINNAKSLNANNVCVVISREMLTYKEEIKKNHQDIKIEFAIQDERLGTGHGVKIALENMSQVGQKTIILYGDTPLIKYSTLKDMEQSLEDNSLCVLGFNCLSDNKYGKLVTSGNKLEKIVEFKDASESQRSITLCNSGVVAIKNKNILDLINEINNNNAAKEYYLTDIVEIIKSKELEVTYLKCEETEVLGVNSRTELARVEELKQNELRESFMANGVTLIDPKTVYFAADTRIENDVIIHPNVVFGKKCVVKSGAEIKSFSHIEDGVIGGGASIGPFARIRPGSNIGQNAKIGNFVEIKKSNIEPNAKIGHLSYIGDAQIGENTNIGAGTITCNYDGYNKFSTKIEKDVFIGSNTALIAPITIKQNSVIGAGSVISKDVEENDLAISRTKQTNLKNGATKYHNSKKN